MKVLHLIDSGGLYGAERMLLNLVQEQINQGLEPMILSAGEPHIEEKPIEVEARRLGLPVTSWRMTPGLNLKEAWRILQWAQARKYQLMHSHGFKFNVLVGMFPKFVRKIPSIATLHGYVHAKRFSKMWLYECIDRIAINRIDGVVLVGEAMKGEISKRLLVSRGTRVIPNGLSLNALKEKSSNDLEENIQRFIDRQEIVIVGIGRLSPEKAFDYLIRAFEKVKVEVPGAALILVGEGKQREPLEGLIKNLDLSSSVLMPGYCSNVPALLKQAKLLVMPSLTEGLPITLLEAMALETPVVVSAVGEMPKVIGYGQGGRVTNSIEPNDLATAIVEELNDNDLPNKTKWALHSVEENYSAAVMADKYYKLYKSIINV